MIFFLSTKTSIDQPKTLIGFFESIGFFFYNHGFLFVKDIFQFAKHNLDKVEHFTLYTGFGILLHFTFYFSKRHVLHKYAFVFAIIVGIAYGATDELHQMYVPGRTESLLDLAADALGVIFGQVISLILIGLKKVLYHKKIKSAPTAKQ